MQVTFICLVSGKIRAPLSTFRCSVSPGGGAIRGGFPRRLKPLPFNPPVYSGGECPPIRFSWNPSDRDELSSRPAVFSSCAHIPKTHFDTCLVRIDCYGYEIFDNFLFSGNSKMAPNMAAILNDVTGPLQRDNP